MAARIDSPAVQARRSRVIAEVNRDWILAELATGLDGPVPPDRPDPSDYNLHVPELDADGAAWDRFIGSLIL